jgi:hypothetical protein
MYSFFNSWLATKLKVYKYFFSCKNIATIKRERKKIKSLKQISDKKLFSFFSAKLEFGAKPNLLLKLFNPLIICYYRFIKRLL